MSVEVAAIFGPTASGKSAVAEALADLLATEIVSADALQVYHGLPILTNQPTRATRLVAIRALSEEMSVGEYATLAHQEIDSVVEEYGSVVLAGGSGLYFRAAVAELELPPPPSAGRREHWEGRYEADAAGAYALLERLDPAAAEAVHVNDRRRVVRALELAESGASLSPASDRLWGGATRRPTRVFGIDVARDELDRRIAERTDAMFARGAIDEAQAALRHGVSRTAAKALGLRDLVELPPREARERLVSLTRRYAGYQRKWMYRIPGVRIVDGHRAPGSVADEIASVLRATP